MGERRGEGTSRMACCITYALWRALLQQGRNAHGSRAERLNVRYELAHGHTCVDDILLRSRGTAYRARFRQMGRRDGCVVA